MLRARGHRRLGVLLDSGDLAYLSIEARQLLDAAGFTDTAILVAHYEPFYNWAKADHRRLPWDPRAAALLAKVEGHN